MTSNAKTVFDAALKLPRKSRANLAEKLLASLDDEQEILAAAQEADRRFQAYKRGEIQARPVEEAIRDLRKRKKP
jgi:putative addiction module component (TIGR02574 family)